MPIMTAGGPMAMNPLMQRLMQMRQQQGGMTPGNTGPTLQGGMPGNSMPQGPVAPPQTIPNAQQPAGGMMGAVAPQDPNLIRRLMLMRQQQQGQNVMPQNNMPGQPPINPPGPMGQ